MTGNFNIRDSSWNPLISFHLVHSNLLTNIANFLDLLLSNLTNQVLTRYLDNMNNSNLVIDLMFLRPSSFEFDNYTIYPKFQYSSDYTPLIVDISIIKEFIPDKQYTIIKNSEEENHFITELIEAIKKVDTKQLIDKESVQFKNLQKN